MSLKLAVLFQGEHWQDLQQQNQRAGYFPVQLNRLMKKDHLFPSDFEDPAADIKENSKTLKLGMQQNCEY